MLYACSSCTVSYSKRCFLLLIYDETVEKIGDKVYKAELEGIVTIYNGIVILQ